MKGGKKVEIYEIAHRIYAIGKDKGAGWRRWMLKDPGGSIIARGKYADCVRALSRIRLTAAMNAR